VSTNTSSALMCFQPVEPEIGGQTAPVFPQPGQQFLRRWCPADVRRTRPHQVNLDGITFLESECLNDLLRQAHGQAVTPLGDSHDSPQHTSRIQATYLAHPDDHGLATECRGPTCLSRLLRFGLRFGHVDGAFHQHSLLLELSDVLVGVAKKLLQHFGVMLTEQRRLCIQRCRCG
jgi:hypothetical protein